MGDLDKKKCSGQCGLEKTEDCFSIRHDNGNRRRQCNSCRSQQRKAYKKENKIKISKQDKEYKKKNKINLKNKRKEYEDKNKEKIIKYKKEYYYSNKEFFSIKSKKYQEVNKEKLVKYNKDFYVRNKEKNKEKKKIYRSEHKEERKSYAQEYKKERNIKDKKRKKNDPAYRIMCNFRSGFRRWVKFNGISKNGKSIFNCLSYSYCEYLNHIKSQFEWWMTFENQGIYDPKTWDDNDPRTWRWQLDHIKPQSTFILKSIDDIETIQKCWALSNLRPLSAKQNQLDGATKIRHG